MHFILSPVGSAGDIHPYVGLALILQQRGHEVTFITNGYFRELIESHGLRYVEFGTADEFLDAANAAELWHPRKALGFIFNRFVEPYAEQHIDLIRETYEPGAVVLTSCLGIGPLITRETDNIPVITVHLQPSVIWSDIRPPKFPGMFGPRWMLRLQYWLARKLVLARKALAPVNRLRAAYGLEPIDDLLQWWHSPDGVLCLFPEWYCPPQDDWPEVLQAGFPLWDAGAEEPLSGEVEAFLAAGPPPIAFTPGSANRFGKEFFQEAIAACERIDARGLLLTKFSEQVPSHSDRFLHATYVPFAPLLPRCSAVVHHGGIGSTAQSLRAGTPQLIMALAHDQYDNGERIEELGAGCWIPSSKFRASRVADMLRQLQSDPAYAQAAQSVAERMDGKGLVRAAELLEAHLRS